MFIRKRPPQRGYPAVFSVVATLLLLWGCGNQPTSFEDNQANAKKPSALDAMVGPAKDSSDASAAAIAAQTPAPTTKEQAKAIVAAAVTSNPSLAAEAADPNVKAKVDEAIAQLPDASSTDSSSSASDTSSTPSASTGSVSMSSAGGSAGSASAAGGSDGSASGAGGSVGSASAAGGSAGSASASQGSATGSASGEPGILLKPFALDLVQAPARKLDILWIVDSSMSMAPEQAYLGQNFSSFMSQLAASNTDFQTAVTTSDICQDNLPQDLADRVCPVYYGGDATTHLRGSFVGARGSQVMSYQDPTLVADFARATAVGANGSNFEHDLKATELAVTKVLSGENDPLIRDDAFLSVIIVSDEDDNGIKLGELDPDDGANFVQLGLTTFHYDEDMLIHYLNGTKGAGKYSISAITGTRKADGTMCSSNAAHPLEEGAAFIRAAQKTGGFVQSICATDWAGLLSHMGEDLNAQITQVHLDNPAVPTSVQVFVDGTQVTGWTFVEGSNSIKFNSDAIPAPGASIHVEYTGVVASSG